jgi:hypothetical protein
MILCFFDATPNLGRNLGPEFELPPLDSIDPESRRKAIQNMSQFDGFSHAKTMVEAVVLTEASGRFPSHAWTVPAGAPVTTASTTITSSALSQASMRSVASPLRVSASMPSSRNRSAARIPAPSSLRCRFPQPMMSMLQSLTSSRSTTTRRKWVAQEMHGS